MSPYSSAPPFSVASRRTHFGRQPMASISFIQAHRQKKTQRNGPPSHLRMYLRMQVFPVIVLSQKNPDLRM